jgi:hypothetical protein
MTLKYSVNVNKARLDAIDVSVGASAKLRIYTGTEPAVGAAATGTLIVEIQLPATWFNAASGVAPNVLVDKAGAWSAAATAPGTAGYFRIVPSAAAAGAAGEIQGTCAQTSGGDMNFDNATIASGQTVTVNTFAITTGNQA